MPFTYAEAERAVKFAEQDDMGKNCPFGSVKRFCYQGECELWVDGHCAFTVIAVTMAGGFIKGGM